MPATMVALPLDDPVVAGLLDGPNLARLAYIGLDGRPRVVPIWFTYAAGQILMVTGPKAEKVRALEANGAVALTIDSHQPPKVHVLLIDGDATLEHVDGIAPEYEPIVRRYLGAATEMYLSQLRIKRQVLIRVTPRSTRVLDFVRRFPEEPALALNRLGQSRYQRKVCVRRRPGRDAAEGQHVTPSPPTR